MSKYTLRCFVRYQDKEVEDLSKEQNFDDLQKAKEAGNFLGWCANETGSPYVLFEIWDNEINKPVVLKYL